MSGPGVGFEYPTTEVSWLKRDVLLFAVSIGCTVDELHLIYVRLPLHCHRLAFLRTDSRPGTPPELRRLPHLPYNPALQENDPRSHRLLRRPSRNSHPWRP